MRADQRGPECRAPGAASGRSDRLPAGTQERRGHRGPRARRGLPAADHLLRRARARGRHPVHRVGRIEPWIKDARSDPGGIRRARGGVQSRGSKRRRGIRCCGRFKTVIAYRTGIDVTRPTVGEARDAFDALARATASPRRARTQSRCGTSCCGGRWRSQPRAGVPVHVHCGGGDPDASLDTRDPPASSTCSPASPTPRAADPRRLAVDRGGGLHRVDHAGGLPRPVGAPPVVVARARSDARVPSRCRPANEGPLRLRRGERARGHLVHRPPRARSARARPRGEASSMAG